MNAVVTNRKAGATRTTLPSASPKRIVRTKFFVLLILILAAVILIGEFSPWSNPQKIKGFIQQFGLWAPVILILLQALQSMISLIPSQVTTIAAGFLFGPVEGFIYSLIGATLGSSLIFLVSKKFGQQLALRFFQPKELLHFSAFFKQKKLYALFMARVAPIFPNDLVSLAAGLTSVSFWPFTAVSTLGFIAQMIILVLFGSQLAEGQVSTKLIIISILVGLLFIIVLFKKQIKKLVIKDLHKVEKSLKEGVKIVF